MLLHKREKKELREKKALRFLKRAAFFGLAFLIATLGQSCADRFFPEFEALDAYLDGNKAVVVFSAPAEPSSAMKNFLFAQDEREIDGKLSFDGNKMQFIPKDAISENHSYKIIVYSGVQDVDGNTLQKNFKKIIHTKADLSPPLVLKIKALEENASRIKGLEIAFDKPIDQKSFMESFSISPATDYYVNWSEDKKTVEILFKSSLYDKTLYSIKIQKGLKDKLNNPTVDDYYWSWTNGKDAGKIGFKVYAFEFGQNQKNEIFDVYENADYSKEIEIVFDKKVLAQSVFHGIKIEPDCSFYVEAERESEGGLCQRAKIKFNEKPKWNVQKTLFINEDIKDFSGFSVLPRKISIKNNSPLARPPKLEFVAFKVCGKYNYLSAGENFKSVCFPIEDYPAVSFESLPIYFVFSIAQGSKKIDKKAAFDGVSVDSSFAGTIALKGLDSLEEEEFERFSDFFDLQDTKARLDSLKAQGGVCALKYSALYKNAEQNGKPSLGLIEFSASEKVFDDKKNFMEESARLSCNKI